MQFRDWPTFAPIRLPTHRKPKLDIARLHKWDCIETTIRLPKGQYRLEVEHSRTRQFPPAQLRFGAITAFKGMENEAIIVVDLPEPHPGAKNQVPPYVGMNRARSILCVVDCDY